MPRLGVNRACGFTPAGKGGLCAPPALCLCPWVSDLSWSQDHPSACENTGLGLSPEPPVQWSGVGPENAHVQVLGMQMLAAGSGRSLSTMALSWACLCCSRSQLTVSLEVSSLIAHLLPQLTPSGVCESCHSPFPASHTSQEPAITGLRTQIHRCHPPSPDSAPPHLLSPDSLSWAESLLLSRQPALKEHCHSLRPWGEGAHKCQTH